MDETVIGETVKFVLAPSCHISHSFLSQFYWLLFIVALWFIEGVHLKPCHSNMSNWLRCGALHLVYAILVFWSG